MGFEEAIRVVERIEGASPEVRPLLVELYREVSEPTPDLPAAKLALVDVLRFLTSPQGRTDANCRAVNLFMIDHNWEWSDELPDSLADILGDMAGALHDTISAPEVAENFSSTPEQLLHRGENLQM